MSNRLNDGLLIREPDAQFTYERLPKELQEKLRSVYQTQKTPAEYLRPNSIYQGDARILLRKIEPNSISLSVWSPPYFVGKRYESDLSFEDWQALLQEVIELHFTT